MPLRTLVLNFTFSFFIPLPARPRTRTHPRLSVLLRRCRSHELALVILFLDLRPMCSIVCSILHGLNRESTIPFNRAISISLYVAIPRSNSSTEGADNGRPAMSVVAGSAEPHVLLPSARTCRTWVSVSGACRSTPAPGASPGPSAPSWLRIREWFNRSRHALRRREAFVARRPVLSFHLRQFDQFGRQKVFTLPHFGRMVRDRSVEFVFLSHNPV